MRKIIDQAIFMVPVLWLTYTSPFSFNSGKGKAEPKKSSESPKETQTDVVSENLTPSQPTDNLTVPSAPDAVVPSTRPTLDKIPDLDVLVEFFEAI